MKPIFIGALAAAATLTACSGGDQGGEEDLSARLLTTAQALVTKLGAPGEKAQMPAADDADVKAFEVEAEKALTALGTTTMPVQGLDSYERLCGPAATITEAYVSAGLGTTESGALPTDDAVKVAKMNENVTRYMGQMLVPLLYSAHCTAVHMPSVDEELEGQDLAGQTEAVALVRNGAYGQMAGLLGMAGSSDIAPDQRDKVIDILVRDAGKFAVGLTEAQRRELAGIIDQTAEASPELKAQADLLKRAVEAAPCGTLCSA